MHCTTVERLGDLLDDMSLQLSDKLVPNAVGNLLIVRGRKEIGIINLLEDQEQIEIWEEDKK